MSEDLITGFKLAQEEINAAGGVLGQQVELIMLDTEGLPERGATATERLISQDGVVAIAGGYHSAVGLAAKEVAHDNHVPVVWITLPPSTPNLWPL